MKRYLVIVYWLLLMVSTLSIGAVAFYLLQRESDRLHQVAAEAVVNTGKTMKSNCELLVDDLKTNSMNALASLSDDGPINMLNWKDNNQYARTVFLYVPNYGLALPRPRSKEREALEPFLHKPSGGWVWDADDVHQARLTITGNSFHIQSVPVASGQNNDASPDNNSQMKLDRQQIREVSKNSLAANGVAASNDLNGAQNSTAIPVNKTGSALSSAPDAMPIGAAAAEAVPSLGLPADPQTNPADSRLNQLANGVVVTQVEGNFIVNSTMTPSDVQLVIKQRSFELITQNQSGQSGKPDRGWVQIGPPEDSRWLGWMRPVPGGRVRGMVLSWASLTQPLANALHVPIISSAGYILRNPAGQAVAAHFANGKMVVGGSGNSPVDDPNLKPILAPFSRLPLDPDSMPGWTLEAYFDPSATLTSFMAVNTVLVTILVISVLVGGTLLLREARREAFEAARKTNFVSNVSHELKTPLTTIRMYAELLGEGRVRDQAKQHSYLSTIIGESQRLTRLVNNVLDFSRLEQGRKQYHPDDIALAPVIQSILEAQRPRLDEAGLAVETDFPPEGEVRVRSDRDALEQVLINLIDNAMKYAAAGRWLGIRVRADGPLARITVSDRGPGVPAVHQERIFEMFHRVDDSITSKLPGAGLGLSIARHLLRDQEGDLRYEPNSPHGASFVATLPLATAIPAAPVS